MNQRIQQFAEQCRFEIQGINCEVLGQGFDEEKFAELIVRECVKVAVNKDSGYMFPADVAGYMAAGRSTAAQMIREHFGVEE